MPSTTRFVALGRHVDFVGATIGHGIPEPRVGAPGCRLRAGARRSARSGSRRAGVGVTTLLTAHAPLRSVVRRSAGELRQKESIT
jgi:hypothetical protein